jgi:hypothetical protein
MKSSEQTNGMKPLEPITIEYYPCNEDTKQAKLEFLIMKKKLPLAAIPYAVLAVVIFGYVVIATSDKTVPIGSRVIDFVFPMFIVLWSILLTMGRGWYTRLNLRWFPLHDSVEPELRLMTTLELNEKGLSIHDSGGENVSYWSAFRGYKETRSFIFARFMRTQEYTAIPKRIFASVDEMNEVLDTLEDRLDGRMNEEDPYGDLFS